MLKATNLKRVSASIGFRPQIVKSNVDSRKQKSAEGAEIHWRSNISLQEQNPIALKQILLAEFHCEV